MGLHSRDKGKRAEREIVALAQKHGLEARRTWQTAQASDPRERHCDVLIAGRPVQVKVVADGFKALYDALEGVEMAFLRADRKHWLVVLPADRFLGLLAAVGGEGEKTEGRGTC